MLMCGYGAIDRLALEGVGEGVENGVTCYGTEKQVTRVFFKLIRQAATEKRAKLPAATLLTTSTDETIVGSRKSPINKSQRAKEVVKNI